MTIRKELRGGQSRLVLDISYRTADGRKNRFRRDAQVQTRIGADAEHRRLIVELARTGTLEHILQPEKPEEPVEPEAPSHTFEEAVKRFRETHMQSALKPTTRNRYERLLIKLLVPRFGPKPLSEVTGDELARLDAELVGKKRSDATRRNVHIVLRSVLRHAATTEMLDAVPKMPKLPSVGRTLPKNLQMDEVEAVLKETSDAARVACELAAFAGLRASEVRGLAWSDIDLQHRTITIRRAITLGKETTPKSRHQRAIPMAARLQKLLSEAAVVAANRRQDPKFKVATTTKNEPLVAVTARGEPWGETGLHQALKQAQKRAGKSGWCFHDLRHFFATELFRRGASAPVVQQLLGHRDLATTQRYADLVASDRRAAIALFDGAGDVQKGVL